VTPAQQRLLVRTANRLEKAALDKHAATLASNPARPDEAKRTRDHELGDVRDLKELAKAADAERNEELTFLGALRDSLKGYEGDLSEALKLLDARVAATISGG
jgi:hypothetical protein